MPERQYLPEDLRNELKPWIESLERRTDYLEDKFYKHINGHINDELTELAKGDK